MPVPDQRDARGRADDDAAREIAEQMEREHPGWIVVFGSYSREFVCFPRFQAPPGFLIVAMYPKAAAERMSEVERLYRIREGLAKWKA
jgi:hypothetical protein